MRASSRLDPPVAALFILLFVALVLAVVALVRSAGTSPVEFWMEAMSEDDYDEAALIFTDESGVGEWLARTEALALRHGEIEGLERRERTLALPGEESISVVTVTWEDGYSRCLLLRQEDDSLGLAGGYFDCEALDERVPEGSRLRPEVEPPEVPFWN
ncbi:MAG: hypothetical protein ACFB50_15805 [Rubrobacteraceae bacterium]